jgi:hypothetical protein
MGSSRTALLIWPLTWTFICGRSTCGVVMMCCRGRHLWAANRQATQRAWLVSSFRNANNFGGKSLCADQPRPSGRSHQHHWKAAGMASAGRDHTMDDLGRSRWDGGNVSDAPRTTSLFLQIGFVVRKWAANSGELLCQVDLSSASTARLQYFLFGGHLGWSDQVDREI